MGDLKLDHGFVRLYQGDSRRMDNLQDGSVQCVVTSPPYWGLRQYAGGNAAVWDETVICHHQWEDAVRKMTHHKDKALAAWSAEHFRGGGINNSKYWRR